MIRLYPRISAFALALPLLLLAGRFARAEEVDCSKASTTAEMRACENSRYEEANRQLNAAYARLMKALDGPRKEKLRVAQRAWIRFRDANADFLASEAEGGTLAPLLRVSALADMTEARVKELAKLPVH